MSAQNQNDFNLPMVFQDTEIIADPLNRLVSISKFEKRIICCPEFQRLRRIKQLGFAHFVYPAAEYSRFIHSIGVCHQAKHIVDTINKNLENEPRYQQWRLHGRVTDSKIDRHNIFITPFERVIIATAALLHDLPHGPFSHDIEGILTDDGENLIPDHDKVADNPALFLYLFDKDVSELAELLEHFNKEFFSSFSEEFKNTKPSLSEGWRESLAWLRHKGVLTETGMIKVGGEDSPLQFAKDDKNSPPPDKKFWELPFLTVAIFEVLLFEKQNEWLSPEEKTRLYKSKKKHGKSAKDEMWGVIVKTNWTSDTGIRWQPIPGWFRAYRKDIIGNTICADLIDYVNRDGYHTGIVSTIDLKFLDRMMIVRAMLPSIGADGQKVLKPSANTVNYSSIPVSCEHVVFDIYDHKRGFIRQSVLTEILAYLQARYLLCERVYNHRVVEAARSMLQKIILILGNIKVPGETKNFLAVSDLHPLVKHKDGDALAPISDESFLNWVRALPKISPEIYKQHPDKIDDAIELATLLMDRRVFREAIIYDGLHGFLHPGKLGGAEVSCRALEAAFLTDSSITLRLDECLKDIEQTLKVAFDAKMDGVSNKKERLTPRTMCLVSVRKWGKRYKPPLVLVSRPLKQPEAVHGAFDVEPLMDCEDPSNIKKQLDALKASYDSLWKVYLFIHPIFHGELFKDEHVKIQETLNAFASKNTGVEWKNAIVYDQLLTQPLDNAVFLAQPGKLYFANVLVPARISRFTSELTKIVAQMLPAETSRFADILRTENFKETIKQQLLKAGTEDLLDRVVSIGPGVFRKNITTRFQGKIPADEPLALTAREIEVLWHDLIIEAIQQVVKDGPGSQSEFKI